MPGSGTHGVAWTIEPYPERWWRRPFRRTVARATVRAADGRTYLVARACAWYADKLGLEATEEREGGLRYEGRSGVFCLFASAGAADGSFTQLGFYVDDIEATVAEFKRRGVVFEEYPGCVDSIMDVAGNYPSKGSGERAAWFRDSEGNMLGVAQVVP